MFVGYDSGREDGARNRLPAASKGRVHAWLDITRVGKPSSKSLTMSHVQTWPSVTVSHFLGTLFRWNLRAAIQYGLYSCTLYKCTVYSCTIKAFCWRRHIGLIGLKFHFTSKMRRFWGLQIHCWKYVAERLHCKWCQSQTDFTGGIQGLAAAFCPGLPETFENATLQDLLLRPHWIQHRW